MTTGFWFGLTDMINFLTVMVNRLKKLSSARDHRASVEILAPEDKIK